MASEGGSAGDMFNRKPLRSAKSLVSKGGSQAASSKSTSSDTASPTGAPSSGAHRDGDSGPAQLQAPAAKREPADAPSSHAMADAPSSDAGGEAPAKKPFTYRDYLAKKAAAAAAIDAMRGPSDVPARPLPVGAPNCLASLTFVFTGELDTLSRDSASDLVKRYGGRVTTAPSSKTSYVVVGREAGPAKLEKVKALGLKTLDEDAFYAFISSSSSSSSIHEEKARIKESEIIEASPSPVKRSAAEVLRRAAPLEIERAPPHREGREQEASMGGRTVAGRERRQQGGEEASDMWTSRYAPKCEDDLIGNRASYEKLLQWLGGWTSDAPAGERAVLISGPPGIGKTTAAHLACDQLGLQVVEMNASDVRNKKSLSDKVRDIIDNRSLAGSGFFFRHVDHKENSTLASRPQAKDSVAKQVLIMDEVDGMSGGDRGGMAEIINLIKKTRIPIVCICNDRSSPKVRSLANHCVDLRFRRPDARMIAPRIATISAKEGLSVGTNVIEELVASTQGDIRQIINLLSAYKLTASSINFDEGKMLGQAAFKDIDKGPFDALPMLLSTSYGRMSLSAKVEQYFVDGSLMPLMMQENYIKSRANSARLIASRGVVRALPGAARPAATFMELCCAAADSISSADLVESLMRGANQEWSLAPLHGVMSCVLPAYYVHGNVGGRIDFAGWLGQNSRQGKNCRLLAQVTKHTFTKCATDRTEMRLYYVPRLAACIVEALRGGEGGGQGGRGAGLPSESGVEEGGSRDVIAKTIAVMDEYYLLREDVDTLLDLSLDATSNADAFGRLPTALRTSYTRRYNQGTHKLPYAIGGGAFTASVRRISSDIAGANDGGEEDDDEGLGDEAAGDDDGAAIDQEISSDKMIKAKKTTTTTTTAAKGSAVGASKRRKA